VKLTFDVWMNAKGEVHMTCGDSRLEKPVNIRAKEQLESTRVLRAALAAEKLED
jgi:hypothetical protein